MPKHLKPTIALLDDHKVVRKGIRNLLEAMDEFAVAFDVENFDTLKKELKRNRHIDILLLDIRMPDISGFDVATWMKDNYPLTKILAFSSESDGFSIAKIMRNGAMGFVSKSADEIELLQAIQTVLNGDSYLNQDSFNKFSQVLQNSTNYFTKTNVDFTEKELEFIKWSCTALTYKEIADKMFVSPKSVDFHRINVFAKLCINTRQELAVYAALNQLL